MSPPPLLALLLLPLLRAAAQQDAICDAEYVCEFTTAGLSWDLRTLCLNNGGAYTWQQTPTSELFAWQVCGQLPATCNPFDAAVPRPQYSRGAVIQFHSMDKPGPPDNCSIVNNLGFLAPCTRDCSVLGVGAPVFGPYDPLNPGAGINATYIAVDALEQTWGCSSSDSGRIQRAATITVLCDEAAIIPSVEFVQEYEPCKYAVVMRSALGCGRVRDCWQKNCGPDGAGGYCGGAGNNGRCDSQHKCSASGQCCAADCRNRACGGDGCGGSCGTCGAGSQCTKSQTCAVVNASPSPQPASLASASITTSTSGDYMAAYIGGIVTVPIALLGASFVYKLAAAARAL